MRYLLVFMLLVGIFVLGKRSCHFGSFNSIRGEGPVQSEQRQVGPFQSVSFDIAGKLEISSGAHRVEVFAQGNLLPHLKTDVEGGTLRIYFDENISYTDELTIKVSAPTFESIAISGSGTVQSMTPLQSDRLELIVGGSGEINLNQATVNSLGCDISGSGDVRLGGTIHSARVSISGSGSVMAKDAVIDELRVDISGSGEVKAHVLQVLKASISGSGDVYYSGTPSVESSVSGSGSVKPL